jgi:hypothetical protein
LYAYGHGQTVSIGSKSIVFIAEQPLMAGLTADLNLEWPALLDDTVRLQVHLRGNIDKTDENKTFLQIMGYEFRTRAASQGQLVSAAHKEIAYASPCPGLRYVRRWTDRVRLPNANYSASARAI